MHKNCKVVATYFGERRTYPRNMNEAKIVFSKLITNEITLNPGVNQLDTIIVNHDCGNIEANEYLNSLDGKKTYSGKIKIVHRPWNNGIGMSFASFNYAFEKFRDDYDYWFFQEDDYKVIYENYYSEGIEILNKNPKLAYLGYDRQYHTKEDFESFIHHYTNQVTDMIRLNKVNGVVDLWDGKYYDIYKKAIEFIEKVGIDYDIHPFQPWHDGGMGLTHKKFLDEIYNSNGSLPYANIENPGWTEENSEQEYKFWWWLNVFLGEVAFANVFVDFGYYLDLFIPTTKKYKDNPIIHSPKDGDYR